MSSNDDKSATAAAGPALSEGLGPFVDGRVYLVHDDVSDRLDEMADLCEHWKRWRETRGHTPQAVRSALLMLAHEVTLLAGIERKHGHRAQPVGPNVRGNAHLTAAQEVEDEPK